MNKPIMFLLGLLLLGGACTKDDTASNTDKLTTGKWKLTASTSSFTFNGNVQTFDVYAQLGSCLKDDTFEFKPLGIAIKDEGATKCNVGDPQQLTGTWAFGQNETHLIVAGIGYNFDAEILEFTDTKLHVKYVIDQNGIVTTYDSTFEKI